MAAPPKDKELPKEVVPKERELQREEIKRDLIERSAPPFNLQARISKVKIVVPFNEIIRILEYRGHLSQMIKSEDEAFSTITLSEGEANEVRILNSDDAN